MSVAGPRGLPKKRIAQLISALEDGRTEELVEIRKRYWRNGTSWVVGITGPAGTGKSTLIDALITALRSEGMSVAILAIDPSSRATGGALLGDRVRMTRHLLDPDVFTRSIATRGHVGGLSRVVPEAIQVLDAAGYDVVLVETIGVGQDEVEVADSVNTVVLVTAPGLGDEIQEVKAGVMEIADIVVLNKADRLPSWDDETEREEEMRHHAADPGGAFERRIIKTSATEGGGVAELVAEILRHQAYLAEGGRLEAIKRTQLRRLLDGMIEEAMSDRWLARVRGSEHYETACCRVLSGEIDLHTAAEELLEVTAPGQGQQ